MGSRAQVHIKDTGVYLYTHWGANHIEQDVIRAIGKQVRWTDPEYLTRIIFDSMKGNNIESETGYGIGTQVHGDIETLVTVSCDKKTIRVEYMYSDELPKQYNFQHCVSQDAPRGYTVADFLNDTQHHFGGQS